MAMKKIKIGKSWVYLDVAHADRILLKIGVSKEMQAKVKKKLEKRQDQDRKIAREMKQRGIGPNSPGNQLAGWVPRHKNIEESSQTIDGNPIVYSV